MEQLSVKVEDWEVPVGRTGDGPPLIFLHGFYGPPAEETFVEALGQQYEVLAPVIPGFGDTLRPPWVRTMDDLARFHSKVQRELIGTRAAPVVGHSLGGWLAATYTADHDDRVSALVLIDALGLRLDQDPPTDLFALPADLVRQVAFEHEVSGQVPEEGTLTAVRGAEAFARLAWSPRLHDPALRRRLRYCPVDALVIWGSVDRVVSPAYGRLLVDTLPSARLAVIDEAGHHAHLERPEQTASAITTFLSCRPAAGRVQ